MTCHRTERHSPTDRSLEQPQQFKSVDIGNIAESRFLSNLPSVIWEERHLRSSRSTRIKPSRHGLSRLGTRPNNARPGAKGHPPSSKCCREIRIINTLDRKTLVQLFPFSPSLPVVYFIETGGTMITGPCASSSSCLAEDLDISTSDEP